MKGIILSIVIAAALIGGTLYLTKNGGGEEGNANNVSVVDGTQIIEIRAKGGYTPRKSVAKAGIPTVIRFDSNGTFDCSLSVRIPILNISKVLPRTGTTDIAIGTQEVGTLDGTCGMGMYPFEIDFQS